MNRYRIAPPPRWWPPKLSPTWIRLLRPLRLRRQVRQQRLARVEVRGGELLRQALAAGQGVLITPNHPTHADPFALHAAADEIGRAFYFMTAWQVFEVPRTVQRILQWHGCFSVDREGTDLKAFKQAVEILAERPNPLVIFPEGEVYHHNDRVSPFREGAAAIAISAARRAKRTIVCVPCALKYRYLEDPTAQLIQLMDELETRLLWRPRGERPLADRIYSFAEALLALKELEYLGEVGSGTLPQRIARFSCSILERLEQRHGVEPASRATPERIKELRRRVIEQFEHAPPGSSARKRLDEDLTDLFLVLQSYSYPGDYVAEQPSIERMAETLDKLEEDVLDKYTASIRGARQVTVILGQPIEVDAGRGRKDVGSTLIQTLQDRVQRMLDDEESAGSMEGNQTPAQGA